MKVCPSCGYRDGIYWRPRHFDTTIDIARIEDVEKMNPEIAKRLIVLTETLPKSSHVVTIYDDDENKAFYAYRMTRSGMVWRKEVEFLRSEGWAVPSDGAGSKKSAAFKRAISRTTK